MATDTLVLDELRALVEKQQIANELAYQQLALSVREKRDSDPIHKILADLNERIGS